MTSRTIFAVATVFAVVFGAWRTARAAETYTIDPIHTSVVFSVGHAGLSYTYGFFREAAGKYILDEVTPPNCRFQFVIQTKSLDTNNAKRDEHLRSADFFNVQQFPTITFQSTACAPLNSQERGVVYDVTGNLTIHGVTRQVRLPLRMLAKGKGAYGDPRTGFLCQLELKRSDYGMTNLLENNVVGDAVSITVSFEGAIPDQNSAPQPRPR